MKIKNPFHRNSKDASTSNLAGDTAPHPVSTSSSTTTSNAPISNTAPSNISSNLGPTTSTPTTTSTSSSSGTGLAPTTYSSALNPPVSSTSNTATTGGGQQAPGSSNLMEAPSHVQTGLRSFGAGQETMMPAGQGQGQGFQTMVQPVATTIIQKPAVIHEEVREVKREVIQPVINRTREQTEIHQITQPFNEREVRPTQVEERVLQPEYRPTLTQQPREMPVQQPALQSTREVAPKVTQVFQEQAVIEETVHKTIREEIQPVIYKETLVPTVVQQVKPIFEKIVEAPVIVHMERAPIILREGETFQSMLGQQPLGQQPRFMGQGGQGGGFVGQPPSSSFDVKPPLGTGVTNMTMPTTTTTTTSNVNAPLSSSSSAIPASTSNVNPAAPRQNLV